MGGSFVSRDLGCPASIAAGREFCTCAEPHICVEWFDAAEPQDRPICGAVLPVVLAPAYRMTLYWLTANAGVIYAINCALTRSELGLRRSYTADQHCFPARPTDTESQTPTKEMFPNPCPRRLGRKATSRQICNACRTLSSG